MTEHEHRMDARPVVVLGGTGRVGSAVVEEFTARGQAALVISRKPPTREQRLRARPLVSYLVGDAHDLRSIVDRIDARAVVIAVTPFTAPPPSLDGFDGDFYVRIIGQLQSLLPIGAKVIYVAVTAIARLQDGSVVADHEELFPMWLRPFSDAHARGADHLNSSPTLTGTVLIPAAGLGLDNIRTTSQPVLLPEPVPIEDATAAVEGL